MRGARVEISPLPGRWPSQQGPLRNKPGTLTTPAGKLKAHGCPSARGVETGRKPREQNHPARYAGSEALPGVGGFPARGVAMRSPKHCLACGDLGASLCAA
jgi:hypothetical protein